MGGGKWDPGTWEGYTASKSYDTKSTQQIFEQDKLHPSLSLNGVKRRESVDSADNPASTAIIIALDVTGSMGEVIDAMAREGLNTLVTEIYDRKPVSDPHVMCMGIGDAECDEAPLQGTQFEADIRIAQQLELLYLEGHGGNNTHESYTLPWYWAAKHTQIDCWDKRQRKGYLFTVGDEMPPATLRKEDVKRVLGYTPDADLSSQALLALASEQWDVFHVIVAEGAYASTNAAKVKAVWTHLLGQKAIWLKDHRLLAQTVVSAMQIREGQHPADVIASWKGGTKATVKEAVFHIKPRGINLAGAI
jgi:hypothetical protein